MDSGDSIAVVDFFLMRCGFGLEVGEGQKIVGQLTAREGLMPVAESHDRVPLLKIAVEFSSST